MDVLRRTRQVLAGLVVVAIMAMAPSAWRWLKRAVVALWLLAVLAAPAAAGCKATTDIQRFKDEIKKACGERILSVSFTGNHESAKYEIAYALDLAGLEVGGTTIAVRAWETALAIRRIIAAIYPTKHFMVGIKDANGASVCAFVFDGDDEKPVGAKCMTEVVR